jgi:predicted metalloenzyme YecM
MYELRDYKNFLDEIFKKLEGKGVDVSDMELDHIAYRVKTGEDLQRKKEEFLELGELISENIVQNRPIYVFKLKNPLMYGDRKIYCLELPAPGKDNKYESGLQHAEFVTAINLADFRQKYSHLEFIDKTKINTANPYITLGLGDNLAVKFHNESLLDLISKE